MEFEEVYKKERATRKFTNRKVMERLLTKIVKEAQQSPSLLNSQPWRAYAVTGESLENIKKEFKENIDNKVDPKEDFASMLSLDWDTFPSQNMAVMGASQTYFFSNRINLFAEANAEMFNAPAIIYLTIPKKSPAWSVFDLGIFAQSIMLIAINNGLSVMPAHSLVSYPDIVRKYAGISENESVGMAIAIGYKDNNAEVNDDKFIPDRVPFEKIFKLSK
ncbi:nitroreductase [Lactobacillus hamsteri]|uniref:Nitroreductase n=1 Tax=Lactobacillus hamsteri DSM 5661 = JCM 6256 TaxID=1423754 RepID=A0A0R1YFZ2_9LACO|nr:nitroreductase [Lactobacillus hamsteri]KRM41178.1 nitroreductase [Lactobacillus hamsteri DSM 5661 = JCM 6256]